MEVRKRKRTKSGMLRKTNSQTRGQKDGMKNAERHYDPVRYRTRPKRENGKQKSPQKPTTPLHARRQCKTYLPNKSKSETHARQGEMVKCFIRLRRAHVPVFAARPISYACMCYTVTSLSHKRGRSLVLGNAATHTRHFWLGQVCGSGARGFSY